MKNQLLHYCHMRAWKLPVCTTTLFSPCKMALLTLAVSCGGHVFQTIVYYTTVETTESSEARIALENFNVIPCASVAPSPFFVAWPAPPPSVALSTSAPPPAFVDLSPPASVALSPHASLAPFPPTMAP